MDATPVSLWAADVIAEALICSDLPIDPAFAPVAAEEPSPTGYLLGTAPVYPPLEAGCDWYADCHCAI